MGTHPIFESDFDCLTDLSRTFAFLTTRDILLIFYLVTNINNVDTLDYNFCTQKLHAYIQTVYTHKLSTRELKNTFRLVLDFLVCKKTNFQTFKN